MTAEARAQQLLAEKAYQFIRTQILRGAVTWGERLNIRELVNVLSMSRTPIQHALRRLALERLVVVCPQSGTYVVRPTRSDVMEVYQVRRGLEVLALELAIHRFTPDQLREVDEALRRAEQCAVARDPEAYFHSDRVLHGTIVRTAGNTRLIQALDNLRDQIELYRVASFRAPAAQESMRTHRRLYEEIRARDLAAAEATLRRHIESVCTHVLRALFEDDAHGATAGHGLRDGRLTGWVNTPDPGPPDDGLPHDG